MEMTKGIKDTPAHRCVKLYTHLFTSFGTAPQSASDGLKGIMHLQIDMTDVFLYLIEQAGQTKWEIHPECLKPDNVYINDGELLIF